MKQIKWYSPRDGEFPELGKEVLILSKDGLVGITTYKTDWLNRHKEQLDKSFAGYCLGWTYKEEVYAEHWIESTTETFGYNNG